ncbi:class I SAM-dependent methyltransferase [Patescibacteria group bacterium]|nr:class I SAM-dependent methyltransferase [Patescibacteria group bacterium]
MQSEKIKKIETFLIPERKFVLKNGVFDFRQVPPEFKADDSDKLMTGIKIFFKKYPLVFNIFFYTMGGSFVGKSAKQAIKDLSFGNSLILNLGSGVKQIRGDVVNIDFYPFQKIDILADICDLPFQNQCAEAIIIEAVLEHLKNPEILINEILRVLKPEGIVYATVPFVQGFHSSPDDYYRWTKPGLEYAFRKFQKVDSGVRHGPTSAFVLLLAEWLSIFFGLGISSLRQFFFLFFTFVLFPVKLVDLLIWRLAGSENIASGFYYIGKKI